MLTKRQQEILDFITEHICEHGFPPTIREIGAANGIDSPNGVMCHLRALESKGRIERRENESRAIKVLVGDWPWTEGT